MFLIAVTFLFFGICFSFRSSTVEIDQSQLLANKIAAKVEMNQLATNNVATCTPTNFTNSSYSGSIYGPNWGTMLLIVSKLTVGSSPLTNIAFYVAANSGGGTSPSTVDIVVYNSTSDANANPDNDLFDAYLIAKIPGVALNSYPTGQFTCLGLQQFPNLKLLATGVYWVGFYNTYAGARTIARQPVTTGSTPYQYKYVTGTPVVGSAFPSGANSEPNQLIMGTQITSGSCSALPCGQCAYNPNCVWCLSSAACITSQQIPTCKTWTRNPSFCSVCSQYNSCSSCVNQPQCAWCLTNGKPNVCLEEVKDGNCTTAVREPQFCSV